jgi:hypothetical protein
MAASKSLRAHSGKVRAAEKPAANRETSPPESKAGSEPTSPPRAGLKGPATAPKEAAAAKETAASTRSAQPKKKAAPKMTTAPKKTAAAEKTAALNKTVLRKTRPPLRKRLPLRNGRSLRRRPPLRKSRQRIRRPRRPRPDHRPDRDVGEHRVDDRWDRGPYDRPLGGGGLHQGRGIARRISLALHRADRHRTKRCRVGDRRAGDASVARIATKANHQIVSNWLRRATKPRVACRGAGALRLRHAPGYRRG